MGKHTRSLTKEQVIEAVEARSKASGRIRRTLSVIALGAAFVWGMQSAYRNTANEDLVAGVGGSTVVMAVVERRFAYRTRNQLAGRRTTNVPGVEPAPSKKPWSGWSAPVLALAAGYSASKIVPGEGISTMVLYGLGSVGAIGLAEASIRLSSSPYAWPVIGHLKRVDAHPPVPPPDELPMGE